MAETAAALEQRAEERYRAVDYRGAIALYEDAFRAYHDEGIGWAPAGRPGSSGGCGATCTATGPSAAGG